MKVALAFTIRNILPYNQRLLEFIEAMKVIFNDLEIVATSSDASFESQQKMKEIADHHRFYYYKYLGELSKIHELYSMTSNRVAKGRNEYLRILKVLQPEVVIMVDCDNRLPPASEILRYRGTIYNHCQYAASNMCDGIFANTIERYYDIWALRSADCPYDCHKMIREEVSRGMHIDEARNQYLRKHQTKIETDSFIPVDSAFGGFGIYNWKSISSIYYTGMEYIKGKNIMICEHPYFHGQIPRKKLYISGSLRIVPGNNDKFEPIVK